VPLSSVPLARPPPIPAPPRPARVPTYSLFWCYFVLSSSVDMYKQIVAFERNHIFGAEKNMRFELVAAVQKNHPALKRHKVRNVGDVEANLGYDTNITIKTFMAICLLANIRVVLVDDQIMYENTNTLAADDELGDPRLIVREGHRYRIVDEGAAAGMVATYRTTHLCVRGDEINVKSVGGYKLDQLRDMCGRLNIVVPHDAKKNDMHELVLRRVCEIKAKARVS
jgi:hypothetical protein